MGTIINLDNLDPETLAGLRREAARRGVDMSALACEFLREKFGPAKVKEERVKDGDKKRDLMDFAGTWSEEEAREFFAAIADLGKVDEELWR